MVASDQFLPLCEPVVRGNEWSYVKECLDTGWISSVGAFVERFEREFAAYLGVPYAVATVNGTAALHIALLVAGVQPDEEVLVSTLTFIAPANAVRYLGAWPVFVDAEPKYFQMDPQKISDFCEYQCQWVDGALRNKATGRRVTALLPVHILGHPVDMNPLLELARKYNLAVIEDATEALGSQYKGRSVGHLGHIGCFSFNGNKIITTGGGGMIVTDNPEWAERAKYLTTQAKDDPVEFVHGEIGYNYRLTNILAATGCAQLENLASYIAAKRCIAKGYSEAFIDILGIRPMQEADWAFSTYWMYTILIDETEYGIDSRALLRHFAAQRIQTRPLWQPLHRSAAFKNCFPVEGEVAEQLNRRALSLPCSVNLNSTAMARVIELIREKYQHGHY